MYRYMRSSGDQLQSYRSLGVHYTCSITQMTNQNLIDSFIPYTFCLFFSPYISLHKYKVMEGMIEVFGLMFAKILRKIFFYLIRQTETGTKKIHLSFCMTKQDSSISISPTHQKKKGEKQNQKYITLYNSLPHLRNTKPFYIMEQRVNQKWCTGGQRLVGLVEVNRVCIRLMFSDGSWRIFH